MLSIPIGGEKNQSHKSSKGKFYEGFSKFQFKEILKSIFISENFEICCFITVVKNNEEEKIIKIKFH